MNPIQSLAVIIVSADSMPLAYKIKEQYPAAELYSKNGEDGTLPVISFEETTKELFPRTNAILFIGAMGICVRSIAPYIDSKYTDPAVICIDSTGKFVIPVLSGHIGGANEFSLELAQLLKAEAIVTTRSDNTGLWALDTLGGTYNWKSFIYEQPVTKETDPLAFYTELISGSTDNKPKVMNACITDFVNRKPFALLIETEDEGTAHLQDTCPEHVEIFHTADAIDDKKYAWIITISPFIHTFETPVLAFVPRILTLGAGCKKGLDGSFDAFFRQIMGTCMQQAIHPAAIASVASIDLKKEENILLQLAEKLQVPFLTYPAEELARIDIPNPSEKVAEVTGSSSVSEAAACYAAANGRLLVGKQKGKLGDCNDFTYAIAIPEKRGHIEIVGAGPGDPELISIRGRRMLEKADLILYAGSLVPKELTFCAKKSATVRSSADMNLEEQFLLMKAFYDKGKFVVRLHTGDPCIYGAIQEQMAFFDAYGMDYHITPGISSFQAAAAALRSQFTIPEKVQTIILTRGEGRTPMPEKEQLHKLAQSQSTMCIFLSAGIAEQVQKELLEHYPPTTPVAACYKLTWKDERIYRGELKDLARIVKDNHLTLTTLLVVGDAIDNREGLSRLYADEFKHLFRK